MKGELNSKLQYLYIKVPQQLLLKIVTVLFLRFIRYHQQRILLVNLIYFFFLLLSMTKNSIHQDPYI
jgi:hypothetical protein